MLILHLRGWRRPPRRAILLCGLLAATAPLALTLPGGGIAATAAGRAAAFPPILLVQPFGGNFAIESREVDVTVDLTGETRSPGRITIDAPKRFPLDPLRPPGSPIGKAFLFIGNPNSGTLVEYEGTIAAEPLDPQGETTAQPCSPGTHTGIWLMHLAHGGQTLDLPLYLASPTSTDPPGTGLRLDLCPPATGSSLGAVAQPLRIAALVLSLSALDVPKTPGIYVWRAIITPAAADGRTPLTGSGYELRALVPVPHVLSLLGHYDSRSKQAVLSGTLRMRGKPQARALVTITQLDRAITPHGPVFRDAPAAATLTSLSGKFTTVVPIFRTRGYVATTPPTQTRCSGRPVVLGGCRSQTTSGTDSQPITVSVP